jgi:hypothetical protein
VVRGFIDEGKGLFLGDEMLEDGCTLLFVFMMRPARPFSDIGDGSISIKIVEIVNRKGPQESTADVSKMTFEISMVAFMVVIFDPGNYLSIEAVIRGSLINPLKSEEAAFKVSTLNRG